MNNAVHELHFDGALLARGFWLYVWEVTPPKGAKLYYVGRTGDSSSFNAQSPFNRMGQHLGFAKNSSMLRRHLKDKGVEPEKCDFWLVAYGPILEEATKRKEHHKSRDIVAALEKALTEAMLDAGYKVINTVKCHKPLDGKRFKRVLNAFAAEFPALHHKEEKQ